VHAANAQWLETTGWPQKVRLPNYKKIALKSYYKPVSEIRFIRQV